jgi:hypothetical protein
VAIRAGQLLVNDHPVRDEVSLRGAYHPDAGPMTVPDGTVWTGTTLHQTDSLRIGPVPSAALLGKVSGFP